MSATVSEAYASMGLNKFEYDRILELLGREPSMTELGMFAVMWSEHCGYKYSRPILSYFKKYKEAMEGDGLENAGVVNIGDGLGIVMKIESHNHPSAVAPYQGAATGVGGIIRDIFTMGARPIAALNSLRFGPIRKGEGSDETVARTKRIFDGVVAGIAGYGNCVGVPTIAGEVSFHPRYAGNPLVNAMCVGIVPVDKVATAGACGVGNPVIYLGSATGKDGIHGATFASENLDDEGEDKRPNVQIGDPFAEKILIEATLEALETGAVAAIQDMGAAGLTCSTIEMSSKGKVGMDINLDLVPMREPDTSGYELMLSESQERMLAVAHKGREQEIIDVFKKWGTHAVVIGYVTDTGRVKVTRSGHVEADVPAELLTDHCPTYTVEAIVPEYYTKAGLFEPKNLPKADANEALKKLLGSTTLASKRWVFQQYDQQVQTQTCLLPGHGDAAVLAPRGTKRGVAVKVDGNGLWVKQDPYIGGVLAVVEAARNVACTGAVPAAATDGLNFGNPQVPHVYWQFERAVKGIADAAEAMGTPVVSGNVSFYNESGLGEILPTPMVGMMGVLEDASKRVGNTWSDEKLDLAVVSIKDLEVSQEGLGASSFALYVHGVEDGRPVMPSLVGERVLCGWLSRSIHQDLIKAAHDVSEGGTVFALAEMCIGSGTGCHVQLDGQTFEFSTINDSACFGEVPGMVVIAAEKESIAKLQATLPTELLLQVIGETTPDSASLKVERNGQLLVNQSIADMAQIFESAIPQAMKE